MSQYSRTPITAACPFCLHTAGDALYTVTSTEAATHFVAPSRNRDRHAKLRQLIEELWRQDSCQLVECAACSGVFAFPFIGGDAKFYQTAFAQQHSGSYPSSRWEYGESLRPCNQQQMSAVLEIGAGDGRFIGRLHGSGVPLATITALEYSEYGRNAICSRYPEVNVLNGDDLWSLADQSFSHVFLFQVAEHLGNIGSNLERIRQLLTPNGLAFISVPNPARIEFNELNGLVLDMPPNHVSRFSEGAIRALSIRLGFSLQRITDEPGSFKERLVEFLRLRYCRVAQNEGTIPARIDARLDGPARKLAAALYAATILPSAVVKTIGRELVGGSRLFVIQKSV